MCLFNIKISIDDGKGKKANLEISEADNLAKLVIIQNVFSLFGIEKDLIDQVKTFDNAAKAYSQFFKETTPVEPDWNEDNKTIDIKQNLIESYESNKDELETTYKEVNDQPEHIRLGYKVKEDGSKAYRLRYYCVACWNRGNHYSYEFTKFTNCHKCHHEMVVYSAHPDGFPNQDSHGNFLRAGDYKDNSLNWVIG